MAKSKKSKNFKKTQLLFYFALVMFLVVVLGFIFFSSQNDQKNIDQGLENMFDQILVSTTPSVEEQKSFWGKHLEKVILNDLMGGNYLIFEIQERYLFLSDLVSKRYDKPMEIRLSPTYSDAGVGIFASSLVENGVPLLCLIMPKLMNSYEKMKMIGVLNLEQEFQAQVVACFMHELEHLALDLNMEKSQTESVQELIQAEKGAWARNCEYTLRPLIEKNRFFVSDNDQIAYRVWVRSGRNANSKLWHDFIAKSYEPVLNDRR